MTLFGGAPALETAIMIGVVVSVVALFADMLAAASCRDNPPNAAIAEVPVGDRFRLCLMCESYFTMATFYLHNALVVYDGDQTLEQNMEQARRQCYRYWRTVPGGHGLVSRAPDEDWRFRGGVSCGGARCG